MFAPKPAICGNGHVAMQRTYDVDRSLMIEEKKTQAGQAKETEKSRSEPKPKH